MDTVPQCVVQEWLAFNCTLKQQSVVLSALRGCDGISKEDVSKQLTRNMRATFLYPCNDRAMKVSHDHFMKGTVTDDTVKLFLSNLDPYPVHWLMHFMHAAEIIGYKHPDTETRKFWYDLYHAMVRKLHFNPETKEQCDRRLSDDHLEESGDVG